MSKRSIIVILKTFLPASEAFILDQIMAMHQKYDVFVVCSALSNENEFPEDRVMILSSPGKTALLLRKLYEQGFTNILFQTRTDKDLMQIIAEVNPACIVVHFGTNLMIYPCLQDISIPVSVWFHGYDASAAFSRYSGYRKILLSMLSQKHIHPIFVSKGIKAIFESHIGWEVPGDIHYLGVPMDFGKASLKDKKIKTSTNPYQFLQVGRLVEKKGHLYTLEALTLHEAVPGHHLQMALTQELENLPAFRRNLYVNAFGEGWGLYAESLGYEIGLYKDPYSRFGQLTYDMWRACRLVIDVGVHAKGWSRQQSVDYLAENTALSMHEVNTEINRYIAWPGQALAYKMGDLKIKELRKRAESALGDKFDVRKFHDILLSEGTLTLRLMDKLIDRYIAANK